MDAKEILQKAILEAMENGLEIPNENKNTISKYVDWMLKTQSYCNLIFHHGFAKAFWGENHMLHPTETIGEPENIWLHDDNCYKNVYQHKKVICYLFHLQNMVLEEHPLKYLEKFLKKGVK